MAEKNSEQDKLIENPESEKKSQPPLQKKGKPLKDPLLMFISEKEKSLNYTISDRTIALLRREISKNPKANIEDIWRRIYG